MVDSGPMPSDHSQCLHPAVSSVISKASILVIAGCNFSCGRKQAELAPAEAGKVSFLALNPSIAKVNPSAHESHSGKEAQRPGSSRTCRHSRSTTQAQ